MKLAVRSVGNYFRGGGNWWSARVVGPSVQLFEDGSQWKLWCRSGRAVTFRAPRTMYWKCKSRLDSILSILKEAKENSPKVVDISQPMFECPGAESSTPKIVGDSFSRCCETVVVNSNKFRLGRGKQLRRQCDLSFPYFFSLTIRLFFSSRLTFNSLAREKS